MNDKITDYNGDLSEKIIKKFDSYKIKFETDEEQILKFFKNNLDYISYKNSFFRWKFNLAILKSKYKHVHDFTGLLKYNGKYEAFWPFTYIKDINKFTSYGANILNPQFSKNINYKIEENLCKIILETLYELAHEFKIEEILFEENLIDENKFISNWHSAHLKYFPEINLSYNIYVDLSLGYEKIKSYYRRSYKSLINKYNKEFFVKVLNSKDFETYNKFKKLHKNVSGRQTRNDESWNLNFNEIKKMNSYLFYIENNAEMIGGSIINCTENEAYYASGAYDKKKIDYPLSHLIQDKIINFLCNKNIKFYNIGEFDPASYKINKKLSNISKFKMGFKTNLKEKYIFSHIVK